MRPLYISACAAALVIAVPPARAGDDEAKEARMEALRELNDFIGEWKGNGEPEKPRPAANELWSESISWAWRFKEHCAAPWIHCKSSGLLLPMGMRMRDVPAEPKSPW